MINFIKTKWYYIAAAVLLVIVVIIAVKRSKKNANTNNTINSNGEVDSPVSGSSSELTQDAVFPLTPYKIAGEYSKEKGSMGIQIKNLQNIYNKNIATGTPLTVDGKYGPRTLGAFLGFFSDEIASNGVISQAQYGEILKKYN